MCKAPRSIERGCQTQMPAESAAKINGILTAGATLFVTREALYPHATGPMLQLVDADPQTKNPHTYSRGS